MPISSGTALFAELKMLRNETGRKHFDRIVKAIKCLEDKGWVEAVDGGGGDESKAIDRLETECFGDLCCIFRAVNNLPKPLATYLMGAGKEVFLAGGYLKSIVTNEKFSDIDLFVDNNDPIPPYTTGDGGTTKCQKVATEIWQDMGINKQIQVGEVKSSCVITKTQNSYTIVADDLVIQVITRWTFPKIEDCIASFDFTIAAAALWFDKETKKWDSICHDNFYEDLAAKRLVYTSPPIKVKDVKWSVPGSSLLRVLKFYQRGYRIPLDSLGTIISRLMDDVREERANCTTEEGKAKVIRGLLREVDPNINPDLNAYLPDHSSVDKPII